jgi:hypothetical protein
LSDPTRILGRVADIQVLTDKAATAEGIRAGLKSLATKTTDKDVVILFFSGHTTTVPDNTTSIPESLVKALVPHDGANPSNEHTRDGSHTNVRTD